MCHTPHAVNTVAIKTENLCCGRKGRLLEVNKVSAVMAAVNRDNAEREESDGGNFSRLEDQEKPLNTPTPHPTMLSVI